ncbi:MAG: ATP-binding protein, partial [Acidimicrobiales bacterium]
MRDLLPGRDAELDAVDRMLDGVASGPAAVLLTGEAGIGKSTVWDEGVAHARERGFTVLTCRPAAAEVRLSYTGLFDILAGTDLNDIEELATPQRRALDAALLR